MSSTVHRRGVPWALLAALLGLLAVAAALLPATARADTTTATITLKDPLVGPGIGSFGRYNVAISNSGDAGAFPFQNTAANSWERAHCVEFDQGAANGSGILNSGADIALRNDANGDLGNARVKWLVLSSYANEGNANEMAAHQSAIWALTNPTQGSNSLGNEANVRDPGNNTAWNRAKALYATVSANSFSPSWVNQDPAITVSGGDLCAGAERTVTLTGAAWTTVKVTATGGTIKVNGNVVASPASIQLNGQGTAQFTVTRATAGDVDLSAEFQVPTLVQSRNGTNLTNQDFVYLRFQKETKPLKVTFLDCTQSLVVTKTAVPTYTQTFDWTITKQATPATQTVGTDQATVNYEVVVTKSAPVDSDFRVTGQITLTNPNPFPVSGVTVTDELPGATCQVTGGEGVTVPARTGQTNGTATVDYACTRPDKVDGTNTATATWTWTPKQLEEFGLNGEEPGPQTASGTAPVVFGAPSSVVNDAVDVLDAFNGAVTPETLASGLTESRTFTYPRTVAVPASGCTTYPNVASVVNGSFRRDAAAQAEVCRTVVPPPAPPVGPSGTPSTPVGPSGTPVRPAARASLAITKRGPGRATAGQLVPYTITVRNTGRAAARGVVITDTMPAGMTLARRSAGVRMVGGRLTWRAGTLAPRASRTVRVQLRLDSQAQGSRCNVAQATAQNARRVSDTVCTRVTPIARRVQPAVTG